MYIFYYMNTSIIWWHSTSIYLYISLYICICFISLIYVCFISLIYGLVCVLYISYILLYVICYISLYNGIILVYKGIVLVYKYIVLVYRGICFYIGRFNLYYISFYMCIYFLYCFISLYLDNKKKLPLLGSLSILYMYVITVISELCYLFNAMYKSLSIIDN